MSQNSTRIDDQLYISHDQTASSPARHTPKLACPVWRFTARWPGLPWNLQKHWDALKNKKTYILYIITNQNSELYVTNDTYLMQKLQLMKAIDLLFQPMIYINAR